MKELIQYLAQIEKDTLKGIYTAQEFCNLRYEIEAVIKKHNLDTLN